MCGQDWFGTSCRARRSAPLFRPAPIAERLAGPSRRRRQLTLRGDGREMAGALRGGACAPATLANAFVPSEKNASAGRRTALGRLAPDRTSRAADKFRNVQRHEQAGSRHGPTRRWIRWWGLAFARGPLATAEIYGRISPRFQGGGVSFPKSLCPLSDRNFLSYNGPSVRTGHDADHLRQLRSWRLGRASEPSPRAGASAAVQCPQRPSAHDEPRTGERCSARRSPCSRRTRRRPVTSMAAMVVEAKDVA